jgi:predicted ATPase
MLLTIKNVAKIESAEIRLDGITVIAGENNSCKSIVGKSLFSLISAFNEIDGKVIFERARNIVRTLTILIETAGIQSSWEKKSLFSSAYSSLLQLSYDPLSFPVIRELAEKKNIDRSSLEEEMRTFLSEEFDLREFPDEFSFDKLITGILANLTVDDSNIKTVIIQNYFNQEFMSQINNIACSSTRASVLLDFGEKIFATFTDNQCSGFSDNRAFRLRATYIDTPFIIDDMRMVDSRNVAHKADLCNKLISREKEINAVDEILASKKIDRVLSLINSVTDGRFTEESRTSKFLYLEKNSTIPLQLGNLSTGLKSFVIVKRLIENGSLNDGDVLILDEPEIHLHPEWQIVFAEILVLLARTMDLTILLNTHSPYFLNAIEVFAKRYCLMDRCNFYLSRLMNNVAEISNTTEDTRCIYKKLAAPFQKLENIEYED